MKLNDLHRPFPPSEIEWRVGSTNGEKTSGLALAYLTARHVMERLDEVVGPENWQTRYEFSAGTAVCYLSLRIAGEWVTKADGAGATDVEAEKGQISDALKRAAVSWGIGRYLYSMNNVWVDIEGAGKSYRIKRDQYAKLEYALLKQFGDGREEGPKTASIAPSAVLATETANIHLRAARDAVFACNTLQTLRGEYERHLPVIGTMTESYQTDFEAWFNELLNHRADVMVKELEEAADLKALQEKFAKFSKDARDMPLYLKAMVEAKDARKAFFEGAELARSEKA